MLKFSCCDLWEETKALMGISVYAFLYKPRLSDGFCFYKLVKYNKPLTEPNVIWVEQQLKISNAHSLLFGYHKKNVFKMRKMSTEIMGACLDWKA